MPCSLHIKTSCRFRKTEVPFLISVACINCWTCTHHEYSWNICIFHMIDMYICFKLIWVKGPLWLWSYGSWVYNYQCNQCLSPLTLWVWILLRRGVLNTTLCDKVCQWFATGQCFFPGTSVSSTNKIDRRAIAEIESGIKHHKPNQTIIWGERTWVICPLFGKIYLFSYKVIIYCFLYNFRFVCP